MIKDLFSQKQTLSFEVFPPKKDDEFTNAQNVLHQLSELQPDFISVTYGAGGSRSKRTVELASFIQNSLHIPAVAHMTCVGSSKEDILTVTDDMKQAGLSHVLALRGDRPTWMDDAQFENRAFAHASDLTRFLKEHTDLEVAGACYPEKHFEAESLDSDIAYLKEKQKQAQRFSSLSCSLKMTASTVSWKRKTMQALRFRSVQASCRSLPQSSSARR